MQNSCLSSSHNYTGIGERWVTTGVGIDPSEVSKVHSVVEGQWAGGGGDSLRLGLGFPKDCDPFKREEGGGRLLGLGFPRVRERVIMNSHK